MPGDRWTAKQIEDCRDLLSQGKTDAQIAEVIGKSLRAVRCHRHRLGVMRQTKRDPKINEEIARLVDEGLSDQDIADRLGRKASGVKAIRHRLGLVKRIQWTAEDDRQVTSLRSLGASIQEIADTMRRTYGAVAHRSRTLGLGNLTEIQTKIATDRLVQLCRDGLTDEQIARQIGRTRGNVRRLRRSAGIARKMAIDTHGWPGGLSLRSVRILDALALGPATSAELERRLSFDRFESLCPLQRLMRSKLVLRTSVIRGKGRLYFVSPLAVANRGSGREK